VTSEPSSTREPIFRPTYRLLGYCVVVGVLGGIAAVVFDACVHLAQHFLIEGIGHYAPPDTGIHAVVELPHGLSLWWIPLVTTLGGLLSGFIVYRWAPEAEGHGTDAALEAYHTRGGEVNGRTPVVKTVASALTIGSGGVAGREGPTAQIVVGLGGLLAKLVNLRGQERRILLLASMAAGLAAVFQAPLGMAIFAVEILYSGMVFESEALIYTVVSAVTGYAVRGLIEGGWTPIFAIPPGLSFSPLELVAYALLGVFAGLLGAALPTIFYWVRDQFHRIPIVPHVKPALGGLLVGLVGMAVPQVLGTGYGWVELAIWDRLPIVILLALLFVKGPAMALTIGSGGSGGVFAPTITIGAALGAVVGKLLFAAGHLFPGMMSARPETALAPFVLVGMAAVFAGAARTPISTLIMVAEMTGGYALIVPAMLANTVSFVIQRHLTSGLRYPTLYEHQVPAREDSPAHRGVFVRRALQMIEGEGESLESAQLTLPRLVSLLRFGEPIPVTDGAGSLVSIEVAPGSELADTPVSGSIGGISGVTAVAILRSEEMVIPRGPTRIEAGDQVVLIATPEAYATLRSMAEAAPPTE